MENWERAVEGLGGMKILHIAAHLGGGAGKAISGIAIQGQQNFPDTHRILLLQEPEKNGCVRACQEHRVAVSVWNGNGAPFKWADVIVVNWWNHPVMAQFLRGFPESSAPVVLWSHVNGCHYPMLPSAFAEEFDRILFTSPYSLENPLWTGAERRRIEEKSAIVWGMGRFASEKMLPKTDYQNRGTFTVGYVGTLNYGKIHPHFIAFCKEVCKRIPEAGFVLAGDRDAALERDIRAAGLADRVAFPGFVADVPALMRSFDVFGYLLNPEHYGTTENVLLEAMACGVPVVALRQNVEQFIVPSAAGELVATTRQYADCLDGLWHNSDLRERLGRGARAHVVKRYNAAENTARFRTACLRALEGIRRKHDFSFLGDSPWDWFLFFLDAQNRQIMERARGSAGQGQFAQAGELLRQCAPILWEERKSSLRHFAAAYPQDETLQTLKEQMEQECNHGGN